MTTSYKPPHRDGDLRKIRNTLARALEAGEALQAAAEAYQAALDEVPPELLRGASFEGDGVDLDDVRGLIDKLADLMNVPEDAPERTCVPVENRVREALETADRLHWSEVSGVVERAVGVVSCRVTPALARVERELVRRHV